jgi:hypothetical protein
MLGLIEWLFSILFKKRPAAARIDLTWGDPVAPSIRAALAEGNFAAAEHQLAQAPDQQTLDHWIAACSDWDGRPEWLDRWVSQRSESALAWLMRGAHSTHWAWQARSSRCADQVSDENFREFFRRLALAESDLKQAHRLNPASAVPAALMIRVLYGQQAGEDHTRATFEQATSLAPSLLSAHRLMLNSLCAKWGGSDEAMFAFARQAAPTAPALQVLIPLAHIEAYLFMDSSVRSSYASQPQIRAEVEQAFLRFRECGDRTALRQGANAFALQFILAQDANRAAQAFAMCEGFVAEIPWGYFGDALANFTKYRARVM